MAGRLPYRGARKSDSCFHFWSCIPERWSPMNLSSMSFGARSLPKPPSRRSAPMSITCGRFSGRKVGAPPFRDSSTPGPPATYYGQPRIRSTRRPSAGSPEREKHCSTPVNWKRARACSPARWTYGAGSADGRHVRPCADPVRPAPRRGTHARAPAADRRRNAARSPRPSRGRTEKPRHPAPLNEWLHGQLITALYRSGRRGDALQAYQKLRGILQEELGLDPSRALQHMQRVILSGVDGETIAMIQNGTQRSSSTLSRLPQAG